MTETPASRSRVRCRSMRKRQNREIGEGENDDMSLLRSGVTLGGPSIPPLFHAMILHGNSIGVRAGSRERPRPDQPSRMNLRGSLKKESESTKLGGGGAHLFDIKVSRRPLQKISGRMSPREPEMASLVVGRAALIWTSFSYDCQTPARNYIQTASCSRSLHSHFLRRASNNPVPTPCSVGP